MILLTINVRVPIADIRLVDVLTLGYFVREVPAEIDPPRRQAGHSGRYAPRRGGMRIHLMTPSVASSVMTATAAAITAA
jgi:hypothetical protein